jgi:hypothetical protein
MNTLIVAPTSIEALTGIAAIKVSARKLTACDATLSRKFACGRRMSDDTAIGAATTQHGFLSLLKVITERAVKPV